MTDLTGIGKRARQSSSVLACSLTGAKNAALLAMADSLIRHVEEILLANSRDLATAAENGMSEAMLDRLRLTPERIDDIADAVRFVVGLEDPIGRIIGGETRPNGLRIVKMAVPLGVVGMIYESRPNVTVDCAALCLKSGNACILRGGKEAIHSNKALVEILRAAVAGTGLPADCIQLIEDTSRETAAEMMRLNGYIDVLIPRGGAGLIQSVVKNSTVPVVETGAGNCHIFVDASADLQMAVDVVNNAKTSRPSVCNAVETLLVHEQCAETFLPLVQKKLAQSAVELRGCPETLRTLGGAVIPATEEDYATEYDDYILAIKVVQDMDEAIAHIAAYSTHHSEAILTADYKNSQAFTLQVDSAAVYVNASTRFTDGGEFGLGAEIGISTQKLHARGPMGLGSLTSSKYIITGDGQIR